MYRVDLNSDLGESFGRYTLGMDEKIIPLITSANVACGFHASDPVVMEKTCLLYTSWSMISAFTAGAPRRERVMSPILAAPAVWELDGPIMTGPKISNTFIVLSSCVNYSDVYYNLKLEKGKGRNEKITKIRAICLCICGKFSIMNR